MTDEGKGSATIAHAVNPPRPVRRARVIAIRRPVEVFRSRSGTACRSLSPMVAGSRPRRKAPNHLPLHTPPIARPVIPSRTRVRPSVPISIAKSSPLKPARSSLPADQRGHRARVAPTTSTASNHRPSRNVSGTAVRDRDPPIGDFFPKKSDLTGSGSHGTRKAKGVSSRPHMGPIPGGDGKRVTTYCRIPASQPQRVGRLRTNSCPSFAIDQDQEAFFPLNVPSHEAQPVTHITRHIDA